jgi:DNA repair protein RadA/Sms
MPKQKTAYVCAECGAHSVKWAGQCPDCAAWNTLSQVKVAAAVATAAGAEATVLDALQLDPEERYATGFAEFDRVLGGGLVPGAVVLLGGDPGVGKSTLLQQVSGRLQSGVPVLYATGEESLRQVGQRARRLDTESTRLQVLADTALENVLGEARRNASRVLIIDSIQTMTAAELTSAPGSVAQLRECVGRIVQFAKQNEVSVFVIGHVTKEGAIAGPRVVEHMVDTVLMTGAGFREVRNPSAIFLSRDTLAEPGSVVSVAWEGSRAILVEMQALVADGGGGYPKRVAQGVDQSRLVLMLAVLQRHGDTQLGPEDVFVNVVGGLKIAETAVDLPTLLAVVSSFRDRPCREGLVSFGEIGLAGEVRPVRYGEERIAAAAKQGFSCAIVPRANTPRKTPAGIEVVPVSRIGEAIDAAF